MKTLLKFGLLIVETFQDLLDNFLLKPFVEVAGLENVEFWEGIFQDLTVAHVILGGGLLGILVFKIIKFGLDLILD